jgi:DNA-binding transcriptional LysR family regulator
VCQVAALRSHTVFAVEFRQVQYFICLLFEEGALNRAARRLNIVQPALSMQIAKLEVLHNDVAHFEQRTEYLRLH